jgi:hypothetical protein
MGLPEPPSEKAVNKWALAARNLVRDYGRTLSSALRSPVQLALEAATRTAEDPEIPAPTHKRALVASFPFVVLTVFAGSMMKSVVVTLVGVHESFFDNPAYDARLAALGHALEAFGQGLVGLDASILLSALSFFVVLTFVTFWARMWAGSPRSYPTEFAALSYLLPFPLIGEILGYAAQNLLYPAIGDSALAFAASAFLFALLVAGVVYGLLLKVVRRLYPLTGWQEVLHQGGYLAMVPILLTALNGVACVAPVRFYASRVVGPTLEGRDKLAAQDHATAEKLFHRAIERDPTDFWSGGARIRLISAQARTMLASLPGLSTDAGLRERLNRRLAKSAYAKEVSEVWRPTGPIEATSAHLEAIRDGILAEDLAAGEIPVTDNELDCSLQPAAAKESCEELPGDVVERGADGRVGRHDLLLGVYRRRALESEPALTDKREYLQFLGDLPIRLQLDWVRYRARNLIRESEALANVDEGDRLLGAIRRERLVPANRGIQDKRLKYPHLVMPDAEIDKLPDRELGLLGRQAYLSYLQAEANALKASPFCKESSLIQHQVQLVQEQLDWLAKDVMYRRAPPSDSLQQTILRLLE